MSMEGIIQRLADEDSPSSWARDVFTQFVKESSIDPETITERDLKEIDALREEAGKDLEKEHSGSSVIKIEFYEVSDLIRLFDDFIIRTATRAYFAGRAATAPEELIRRCQAVEERAARAEGTLDLLRGSLQEVDDARSRGEQL